MLLIIDLIAILFIIVLSFCICINTDTTKQITNKYSCQLSHIIIGLSVIVFYKLVRYFKINNMLNTNNKLKEKFNGDPVSQSINDFISGSNLGLLTTSQAATLSPVDLAAYSSKLDTVINNINALQNKLSSPTPAVAANPANIDSMDLESQQTYQMFQIDYLNKQIKNSQDVLNAQSISNTKQNYKPIKVFSSCLISNADGSITDKPVSDTIQGLSPTPSSLSSAASQQMMQTIGQGSQNSQPFLNLSTTTGALGSFLSNLGNTNGVVNVKA
jgi:hypothetical protein